MPEPADRTITCSNAIRTFRGVRAVDGVTLSITPGICGLVGPNGAGKSTLLKLLTGLLRPDSGQVHINGFDPATQPAEARQQIGVLPENLGLFEELTVEEHLLLSGPIYGLSRAQTAHRAETLLHLLQIEAARHRRARECSFGTRKKAALALALLHRPPVLVLDEPLEGVDAASARTIAELLATLAAHGTTILLTSHILPLLERLASRLLMLQAGKIVWDSSVAPLQASLEEIYFLQTGSEQQEVPAWLVR